MPKKNGRKQNALKHGAYSRQVTLPGEKRADHEALRAATFEEWRPDGVTEEYLVFDLVNLRWSKLRIDKFIQMGLQQRVRKVRVDNGYRAQLTYLKSLSGEFFKTDGVEAVEKILGRLDPVYAEVIKAWTPLEKCKDPTKWGQEIGRYLRNYKANEPWEGLDFYAAIVDPELMEREMAQLERIDEAIDRTIKRLLQVKTAKQIFPGMRKIAKTEPKLINAPAEPDEQSSAIIQYTPEPATDAQIIASEASDAVKAAFAPQIVIAPEESRVIEEGDVSISSDITEKERLDEDRVKVEIYTNPEPGYKNSPPGMTLECWQKICADSDELRERAGLKGRGGLYNTI